MSSADLEVVDLHRPTGRRGGTRVGSRFRQLWTESLRAPLSAAGRSYHDIQLVDRESIWTQPARIRLSAAGRSYHDIQLVDRESIWTQPARIRIRLIIGILTRSRTARGKQARCRVVCECRVRLSRPPPRQRAYVESGRSCLCCVMPVTVTGP